MSFKFISHLYNMIVSQDVNLFATTLSLLRALKANARS